MFKNLSEFTIWNFFAEQIKSLDENTPKKVYKNEERGQTQRYAIAIGDIIIDLFNQIEKLFDYGNIDKVESKFLEYFQRKYFISYIENNPVNEKLIRNMIDEVISAWRLKGIINFLYWIIYKVFGWELTETITLASQVLITNSYKSFLYDPSLSLSEQKVLYDPSLFTPEDKITLVIDVFSDSLFYDKKKILERLIDNWSYPVIFQYKNTPEPTYDTLGEELNITSAVVDYSGSPNNLGRFNIVMQETDFLLGNTFIKYNLMTEAQDYTSALDITLNSIFEGNSLKTDWSNSIDGTTPSKYRVYVARNGYYTYFDNVPLN